MIADFLSKTENLRPAIVYQTGGRARRRAPIFLIGVVTDGDSSLAEYAVCPERAERVEEPGRSPNVHPLVGTVQCLLVGVWPRSDCDKTGLNFIGRGKFRLSQSVRETTDTQRLSIHFKEIIQS